MVAFALMNRRGGSDRNPLPGYGREIDMPTSGDHVQAQGR